MSEALNEIHAYFGKLSTTTTKKVSQWAYGQKLIVHDADLPSVFEAYYSNSRSHGEAKPQIGTDGEAPVPDEYFLSGADIYVFLMEHEGADDGRYRKIVHIPIDPCSQPSDVEPSPVQQNVIDQAIAVLNDAVEQTGEDKAATAALAEAAAASSLIASEAATQAQGSATSASGSATTATNAASTATTKASEAATSAANAARAKTAAETAETNAKAAQSASESAQASAQSAAQTATSKASEASTSATNASGSASAASASASQASDSATQAAASATSASGSATSAATSASTASTKASEASASATAANTAKTAAQTAQTAAQSAQAGAEAAKDETVTEAASIRVLMKDKADIIISTAEGAIATFMDGGNNMPMVSCVAKIEPVQSGNGDPAPDNVRPISGWTGANVVRCGKNLLDAQAIVTSSGHPNYCYISDGYLLYRTGNPSVNGLKWDSLKIPCPATFAITAKNFGTRTNSVKLTATLSDGTTDTFYSASLNQNEEVTQTKTVGTAGKSIVEIHNNWSDGIVAGINLSASQIEVGSTATAYEPYNGSTISNDWTTEAGTVYGGTLDVVSGVLTVDRALKTLTQNDNFTLSVMTDRNRVAWSDYVTLGRTDGTFVADKLKTISNDTGGNGDVPWEIYGSTVAPRCWIIVPSSIATLNDFKTWIASNPIQLVYELATPQTYQLTPTEVKSLLGLNNVWADTGDVEVQYRADTKLYIDGKGTDFSKLIAPTEADYTATRAYTSGSLLIVGNQLYKATTSIANGATLTVGTNITATTLAEVIAAL